MSVVVWDGWTLASDSDMNDGQVKLPFEKIWRNGKNIYGVCGSMADCVALKKWVDEGEFKPIFPAISPESMLLKVKPNRSVERFTSSSAIPVSHVGKLAIGTGRDFAYGAMFMGATAKQAVEAAITFSATCSGNILELSIEADDTTFPNSPSPGGGKSTGVAA